MGPKSRSAENQHAKSDDILATFFSLRYDGREEWYRKAPNDWKTQIDLETRRISDLRKSIASDKKYSRLVNQVETQREKFTRTRAGLGKDTGPPRANKSHPAPSQEERKTQSNTLGPQASFILFQDGLPIQSTSPKCQGNCPNQTVPIYELLDDEEDNPLTRKCPEGFIRYVHLTANNMSWVEVCL
jgi:hypothetical protein